MPLEGFRPYEPSSLDRGTDWAQKIHREAGTRRRMLHTPDTFTKQTTQGVFHRPKPVIQSGIASEPQVKSFSFEARFLFHDSLNHFQLIDSNTGGATKPNIESQIFGATLGSDSDTENAKFDAGSSNSSAGSLAWWSPTLILPRPIPYGWVLDLIFGVFIQSGPTFETLGRDLDAARAAGEVTPFTENDFVPRFSLAVAQNPSTDRLRGELGTPEDRTWSAFENSAMRYVRYRPEPTIAPARTYVSVGTQWGISVSDALTLEPLVNLFPYGTTVIIIGHAFDVGGKENLYGHPEDEDQDWLYL